MILKSSFGAFFLIIAASVNVMALEIPKEPMLNPEYQNKAPNEDNSLIVDDMAAEPQIKTIIKKSKLPSLEGKIKSWHIMTVNDDVGKKYCYIFSYPFDKFGNHKSDRKAYLMLTQSGNFKQEVTVSAGYAYRRQSEVMVSIDGKQFSMLGNEYLATSRNPTQDLQMIKTMLSSVRIMVKSESVFGTYSVDTYLLDGFAESYTKMNNLCRQ
jgi:hypothetical protein